MSKGSNVPEGVSYFSYKPDSNKGSKQPADLNGGQAAVQKVSGGSKGSGAKAAGSSAGGVPAGVKQHSGTDPRGSNPKTKQGSGAGPSKPKGAAATPAGVIKQAGKSVKKK